MAANDGAGAGAVDVNIAGHHFGFDALDVRRTAREKPAGQCVIGFVRDADGFVEIARAEDAQDRAENFFARETHRWFYISENRRRNEEAFGWHVLGLKCEGSFFFAGFDCLEHAPISGSSMTGPTMMPGSSGLPTRKLAAASTRRLITRS